MTQPTTQVTEAQEAVATATTGPPGQLPTRTAIKWAIGLIVTFLAIGALLIGGGQNTDKVVQTLTGIVAAVVVSAALFVGANKLFDQATRRWPIFAASIGGIVALVVFAVLWANRIVDDIVVLSLPAPDWPIVEWIGVDVPLIAVIAGAIGGAAAYLLATNEDPTQRLGIGVGAGAGLGLLAGFFIRGDVLIVDTRRGDAEYGGLLPAFDPVALVVWTLIGAAVGAALWYAFQRDKASIVRPVAFWATIGWVLGAWLASDLGDGSRAEAVIAALGVGLGLGLWVGLFRQADYEQRDAIAQGSRVYIFLFPALSFIAASLVLPLLRSIWLSLLVVPINPADPSEFIGLENYGDLFTDETIINVSDWADLFTSQLFWVAVVLIVAGLAVGAISGRQTGEAVAANGGSLGLGSLGIFLLVTAIFTVLRGTIINNLWWVFTVTILATTFGLAVAVLADRAKYESIAKSFIFMPMAISFVGASIIWRFMYIARPVTDDQTGLFNVIWTELGKLSHSGWQKSVALLILAAVLAGLGYIAYRGYTAKMNGVLWGATAAALPVLWIAFKLATSSLGGFTETSAGEIIPETVLFLQESPWNNFWLMVVLIWIQVGFTMVIFSAAIKAVPGELIEAAKVDGATESQVFWRITVPQIAPTIGVVTTTLIVLVMKVFDIVKVMTNGNFDTQVIANEMWQRAFTELNFGLGSALAVILFLSVVPVMYINIRRMQKAAA